MLTDLINLNLTGKPSTKSSGHNSIPTVVVGCKSDLGDDVRMVTKYEGQAFAISQGAR